MPKIPFPELTPKQLSALQSRFLDIKPSIEKHGRIYFRFIRCKQRLADLIAEMVALGWKYFVRLVLRGKDPRQFLAMFNRRLAQHVKLGRRITGKEKPNDVLSPRAQVKHSFMVQTLPQYETDAGENEALDALADNTHTPPPDQAAFRIDFPEWIHTHTERTRNVIRELMVGERTKDVADRHGTTPSRISQMRRELCADWQRFCGEEPLSDPTVS
jgi:hypothetical protein